MNSRMQLFVKDEKRFWLKEMIPPTERTRAKARRQQHFWISYYTETLTENRWVIQISGKKSTHLCLRFDWYMQMETSLLANWNWLGSWHDKISHVILLLLSCKISRNSTEMLRRNQKCHRRRSFQADIIQRIEQLTVSGFSHQGDTSTFPVSSSHGKIVKRRANVRYFNTTCLLTNFRILRYFMFRQLHDPERHKLRIFSRTVESPFEFIRKSARVSTGTFPGGCCYWKVDVFISSILSGTTEL